VAGGRPDDPELPPRITERLTAAGRAQGLPDPFRDRHVFALGDALDLAKLPILEKDLQTLTHAKRLSDSS
jgi:hypothetical protein